MDKNSKFNFYQILQSYLKQEKLSPPLAKSLEVFYESIQDSLKDNPLLKKNANDTFAIFLEKVSEQYLNPYEFPPYHQRVRTPFDYYRFGIDFLRPLVDKNLSSLNGKHYLQEIVKHIDNKHNVIFFANHQIEADPQAIALLLENEFSQLAEELIFIAGERVTTDPLAIPFSLGCNLLCIYSKRYIDHPPELKHQKQLHNKKTMQLMSDLLSVGGKCIYVAPSGGRDRRNAQGYVEIAPFDPQSIEMFYLMAKKAKHPTFFYPMALATYDLLPPPDKIQIELGEKRSTKRVGIHLSIGRSIDMETFPGSTDPNKHARREKRANYIRALVNQDYLEMQP